MTPSVAVSDLGFAWPDGGEVFDGLDLAAGTGRTGLVGANGAGKSTLLRLLTGELTPIRGSVTVSGAVGYLPQNITLQRERRVDDVLGIAEVRVALSAIESGDTAAEHFTVIGEDWDAEERARATLDRLGLHRRGVLVVVSHDRAMLERMDSIVELYRDKARSFGGNIDDYEAALAAEQETAERVVRAAESDLRRQRRELAEASVKLDRRERYGRKMEETNRYPRVVAHARRREAQVSAGKHRNPADRPHEAGGGTAHSGRRDDTGRRRDPRRPAGHRGAGPPGRAHP
jgi:ATPase subunit of ABC transporter with duplicated ATPase domains